MKAGFIYGIVYWFVVTASAEDKPAAAEDVSFFESKIRPVLVERCYQCHSAKAEKVKGALLLDTREGVRKGGENGPAVVPGDLDKSLLIQAIRYTDPDRSMPPKAKGGQLPSHVIADFERWVKSGAADPREGAAQVVKRKYDLEAAKRWWAFQPRQNPPVPQPKNSAWARSDLDRFILAALEEKGLRPVADADRFTLLRRLWFDLAGLPPPPQEVERFATDQNPEAVAQVVDQLLQSPRFGERWGRHWLDVARFAETSGKDVNLVFPEAWRYRDYVVEAFDQDKPFDQFIREQLAGDLLPDHGDEERARNLTATGFLAIGPKPMNETVARQFAVDQADEQIDTLSQAFLGMTIACARCHDHKFDPISQRDYTAMAGIFLSSETRFGTPGGNQARNASKLIELPRTLKIPMAERRMDPDLWTQKKEALADYVQQRNEELRTRGLMGPNLQVASNGRVTNDGQAPRKGALTDFDLVRISTIVAQLEVEVAGFNPDGSAKPLLMAVIDKPPAFWPPPRRRPSGSGPKARTGFERIGDSPLFARGNILKPGETVPRGLPTFLSDGAKISISPTTSGRLELANWIASPENRLTSRVIVNRIWYWLFGRGLVASLDNFGTTGSAPANAALLDHLATRFVEQGWSFKKLIREIVLSRAYQMSCALDEADFAADPDNVLVWRMNQRRLDAESLRDGILAASGALDVTRPAGSLLANVGEGPVGGPRNKVITEDVIINANHNHRSLYLPIARNVTVEALAVFDFSDPSIVLGARPATTVPPQALYLMNSGFVEEQAAHLAARVCAALPGETDAARDQFDERFRLAALLVWSRPPFPDELTAAREFAGRETGAPAITLWTKLARALFGSTGFRYLN